MEESYGYIKVVKQKSGPRVIIMSGNDQSLEGFDQFLINKTTYRGLRNKFGIKSNREELDEGTYKALETFLREATSK